MTRNDTGFTGAIPQLYDRGLGPALFEPYAADMVARLADLGRGRVLETAAGTGIVTAALSARLPEVDIVATDLNQPMLDHAATKPGLDRVQFRQADALGLPFDDEAFDAVVCQFGAMFFPDRPAAYREARRVLKPGGRFLFSVWDDIADNPLMAVAVAGLSRRYPQQQSWFMERVPYAYRDPAVIRADLAAGGFADCSIETVTLTGPVASVQTTAIGVCQGSPMRGEIEALDPDGLQQATEAVAAAIAARFGSGPFDVPMCALVIEAVREGR